MERKIYIEEDVERIVNGNFRGKQVMIEKSKKIAERQRHLIKKSMAFLIMIFLVISVNFIGLIPYWLTSSISTVLLAAAAYNIGRHIENAKIYGNKDC